MEGKGGGGGGDEHFILCNLLPILSLILTALTLSWACRYIYAPFDAIVVCGTFCTMLVLNVV